MFEILEYIICYHLFFYRILQHFNADPAEYSVIFTSNATAAIKLVAETFDFGVMPEQGNFYYGQENHTSVLGMRELVQAKNKFVLTKDELLASLNQNEKSLTNGCLKTSANSLVVFSAQCNFSGYKMPLELIESIQSHGLANEGVQVAGDSRATKEPANFYVLLDSASYVATSYLDCQVYKPDFFCVSFYKLLG